MAEQHETGSGVPEQRSYIELQTLIKESKQIPKLQKEGLLNILKRQEGCNHDRFVVVTADRTLTIRCLDCYKVVRTPQLWVVPQAVRWVHYLGDTKNLLPHTTINVADQKVMEL